MYARTASSYLSAVSAPDTTASSWTSRKQCEATHPARTDDCPRSPRGRRLPRLRVRWRWSASQRLLLRSGPPYRPALCTCATSTRRSFKTSDTQARTTSLERRVTGYDAPECLMQKSAAAALAKVQNDLKPQGMSLKVYDCYRPQRAVGAFVAWTKAPSDSQARKRFHPRLSRNQLLAQGYIAARSNHSRGIVVDATLVRLPPPEAGGFDPTKQYEECAAQKEKRAPDTSTRLRYGLRLLRQQKPHRCKRSHQRSDQRPCQVGIGDGQARVRELPARVVALHLRRR